MYLKQKIFIIIFLILLFLPMIFFKKGEKVFSIIDNRLLMQKQEVYDIFSWEKYMNDRLGFKEELTRLNVNLNATLFKYSTNERYVFGKDGYIFPKPHGAVEFSTYHQNFINTVTKISEYCKKHEKPFYFVLEPTKSSVYKEYFPNSINYNNEWTKKMLEKLKENGVRVIDNTETLIQNKDEIQVFDVKYNPYHWNQEGAFLGAKKIVEELKKDFPEVQPLVKDDFDISFKKHNYTLNETLLIDEKSYYFQTKTTYKDISNLYKNEVSLHEKFDYFSYWKQEKPKNSLPKVLFFEGSYFIEDDKNSFLIKATKELIGIHSYQNIYRFKEFYDKFNPDCVIFEVAEYAITEAFFGEWAMENFSLNN